MKFENLISVVGEEPVFETGLLLAGQVDPFYVRKQLSRWAAEGKIIQIHRGLYCLAPPYRKVYPHPFLLANRIDPGSYVSLQSALSDFDLIPEGVFTVTSVTTGRPSFRITQLGSFLYRHIQANWLHSYQLVNVTRDQTALVAPPEKALLDLIYLTKQGDSPDYLRELRLQNLDQIDLETLNALAQRSDKPKLIRAVKIIRTLVEEEAEYKSL